MSAPAHPDLADAAALLRALAAAVRAVPIELPGGVPDAEAAEARLAGGVPALTGEPLLSWEGLRRGVDAVAAALASTDAATAAALVRERLDSGAGLDRGLLCRTAVEGARDVAEAAAVPLRVDPDALATMLDWIYEGYKVVPYCGRCGTAWAFPRVRCPSCGESDHERLGYLHAAGEGEYRRAEVCDGCGCYVKSVALLDPPDADRLLELDLETAALDFVALESGYTRAVSALNRPVQAAPAAASSGDTRLV